MLGQLIVRFLRIDCVVSSSKPSSAKLHSEWGESPALCYSRRMDHELWSHRKEGPGHRPIMCPNFYLWHLGRTVWIKQACYSRITQACLNSIILSVKRIVISSHFQEELVTLLYSEFSEIRIKAHNLLLRHYRSQPRYVTVCVQTSIKSRFSKALHIAQRNHYRCLLSFLRL